MLGRELGADSVVFDVLTSRPEGFDVLTPTAVRRTPLSPQCRVKLVNLRQSNG